MDEQVRAEIQQLIENYQAKRDHIRSLQLGTALYSAYDKIIMDLEILLHKYE